MRIRLLSIMLGPVLFGAGLAGPAAAGAADAPLPLGPADLPEIRTVERLGTGVTLTTITRGVPPGGPIWTVTAGFRGQRAEADHLADRVRGAGVEPRVERVEDPLAGDVAGFVVRAGLFDERARAAALASRLAAAGIRGAGVAATVEDGTPTSGPWIVRVLAIDPRSASARAALATDVVPERETTSELAARRDAVAAVNGGYFVIGQADGTPGDLAGLSVLDGDLVSEAVGGRSALVLERGRGAGVQRLATGLTVRAGNGASREIDGLNRRPGAVRSCGGVGGDLPTQAPLHDVTCTDDAEVIAFDAAWGPVAGAGSETVVALDRSGTAVAARDGGELALPSGGRVLGGTGDGAAWLRTHAGPGARLRLDEEVTDVETGRRLALRPGLDVVNGGPRLVRDGAVAVGSAEEGFVQPANPAFRYGFAIRRNPRTKAGVTADGTLLLVAADGRAPGTAVGLSFAEQAGVMRALGAVEALNLDGGGSTALVAGASLRTVPSDPTGERPVGDALVVRPVR